MEPFKTYDEVNKWFLTGSNVETVALALIRVSSRDKRRLKSVHWKNKECIWGIAAREIFSSNTPVLRYFLFNVWDSNNRHIQQIYNNMILKKTTLEALTPEQSPNEDIYCVCRRRYKAGLDSTMIACDTCKNWFHLVCIDGYELDLDAEYHCPFCRDSCIPDKSFQRQFDEAEKSKLIFIKRRENSGSEWEEEGNSPPSKRMHSDTNLAIKTEPITEKYHALSKTSHPIGCSTKSSTILEDLNADNSERLTSTRIDSGSPISDISVGVSKISLEEDKAFFTQEKKSEEDKNSGKKSQLFSPAYEKVEEGSKAADFSKLSPRGLTSSYCFASENDEDFNPIKEKINTSTKSSRSTQRKQSFNTEGPRSYMKEESPEFEDFKKSFASAFSDHDSDNDPNLGMEHSWLNHLRQKKHDGNFKEYSSDSSSNIDENEELQMNDNEDEPTKTATEEEEKQKEVYIHEMNTFLRKLPGSLQFVIPFKDFHSVCYRTDVQLEVKGTKSKPVITKKIVFIPKTGQNLIAKHFKISNPYCELTFYKKNLKQDIEMTPRSSAQLILYATCLNPLCTGKFSFTIKKVPRREKPVLVKVKKLSIPDLIHDGTETSRELSGADRKKMQSRLLVETPLQVERKLLAEADEKLLQCGSMSAVKSLSVLNTAKAEEVLRNHGDLSKDRFTDLFATYHLQKQVYQSAVCPGFIQSISLLPLQITMFSSYSLRMYNKLSLMQSNFFVVIDATSNLLSGLTDPFDSRTPFYYSVFVRCPDKGVTGVPVFEFISTSQTFSSISQCLMSCMEVYEAAYNDPRPSYGCHHIEIDFSKPLLSSVLLVFQRTNPTNYMWELWNRATGKNTTSEELMCVHICRVHVHRFFKLNIMKYFKEISVSEEVQLNLKNLRYGFINSKSFNSFFRRVFDWITLTKSAFLTNRVREVLQNLLIPTIRYTSGNWGQDQFVPKEPNSLDPFWKRSPWSQYASFIADSVNDLNLTIELDPNSVQHHERERNPYYNEDVCHYLLVHIIPYFPILTKLVFTVLNLPVEEDTTNAIECHHNMLKTIFHKSSTRKPPGRFARSQAQFSIGGCKKYLVAMDSKGKSKKPRKPKGSPVASQKSPAASQKSRMHKRGSPEAYEEQFGTGSRPRVVHQSSLRNLVFIVGGLQSTFQNKQLCFGNTCNIDCTLMILQSLWTTSAVGKQFISNQIQRYPEDKTITEILDLITENNVGDAKLLWWIDVLKKPLPRKGNFIDMIGDERDHALLPIFHWIKFLRVRKCSNSSCENFRLTASISPLNADSDWRDPGHIYTTNHAEITSIFSGGVLNYISQESRCPECRSDCVVTYHFHPESPEIFFFSLLQGQETTEASLPTEFNLGPHIYHLYAYTLYHPAANPGQTAHFTAVFYDEGRRLVYDDKKLRLESRKQTKLSSKPVVSVWLMRSK